MYAKDISYEDFNGISRTETYYFNMTKPEMLTWVDPDIDAKDATASILDRFNFRKGKDIMQFFEDLILKSYGVRSEDGRTFIKVDENGRKLADSFKQTAAYASLFMELMSDADKANEFMFGIMPASMAKEAKEDVAKRPELVEQIKQRIEASR